MPRIPTRLLLKAYRENPLLLDLLKECRTLEHARNELRWLHEAAVTRDCRTRGSSGLCRGLHTQPWQQELKRMCADRGRGKPLQYILGDQPFGNLEILCEKGVLIPRAETESYTSHARDIILEGPNARSFKKSLRVLDLCSGSGCISLLLHSLLAPVIQDLTIIGVDASSRAVRLSERNKAYNLQRNFLSPRAQNEVSFLLGDVLELTNSGIPSVTNALRAYLDTNNIRSTWDVLISNPPYISPSNFVNGTTSRSVRRYEPIEALIPPLVDTSIWNDLGVAHTAREDIFYARMLSLVYQLDVKLAIFECGDLEQAQRVVAMVPEIFGTVGAKKEQNVYIWDDCYTTSDYDGGARAVILERMT